MLNLNFDPFPELITERLRLREVTLQDTKQLYALRSSDKVMQYIERPLMSDPEEAVALILLFEKERLEKNSIAWAISMQNDNELIGTISFWRIDKDHHRGEIGYMLHPDSQGKGIATEALKAALLFGKEHIKLHSIEANINPDNSTSEKLLVRCGFMQEAHYKENYFYNGKYYDSKIFSILAKNIQ